MDYQNLLKEASSIVVGAGNKIRPHFGNIEHETKSHSRDFVTKLDLETEKFIATELSKKFPNIGFQGEEHGVHQQADTYWLCDPIDGTMQFIRGIPFCTTMLALIHEDRAVVGIINNFVTNELYTAIEGQGAKLNGKRISVSKRPINEGVIILESNQDLQHNIVLRAELRKRYYLMQLIVAGHEFGLIASGKIEGRVCQDPYGLEHDFAPGTLIVKEAGGVVTNIGENNYDFHNLNFIAATPVVYDDLVAGSKALLPIDK